MSENQPVQSSQRIQIIEEVPVTVERIVEKPYEVIVQNPVQNIIENRYYVDNVVEKFVEQPKFIDVEKIVERKSYKQVEKRVDVNKYVEKKYDVMIEVPREFVSEIPVPREKLVQKSHENLVVRPHKTQVIENEIVVQVPVN